MLRRCFPFVGGGEGDKKPVLLTCGWYCPAVGGYHIGFTTIQNYQDRGTVLLSCPKLGNHRQFLSVLHLFSHHRAKKLSMRRVFIDSFFFGSRTKEPSPRLKDRIAILSSRAMSKHAPKDVFEDAINADVMSSDSEAGAGSIDSKDIPGMRRRRLMEGICVKDGDDLHLLCDDSRSLMRALYNQQLVVLRAFKCPI
ncbi:MAG: hypothetical protein IJF88_09370 [Oscillospiraceae bacterium]|nr:hypothetical protein [Oscillospiraceae bacterium]